MRAHLLEAGQPSQRGARLPRVAYAALQSLEVRWNRVLAKEKARQKARERPPALAEAAPPSTPPPPAADPASSRVSQRPRPARVRRSSWMS